MITMLASTCSSLAAWSVHVSKTLGNGAAQAKPNCLGCDHDTEIIVVCDISWLSFD